MSTRDHFSEHDLGQKIFTLLRTRARRRLHALQAAHDRAAHPPAHGAAQDRDARRLHRAPAHQTPEEIEHLYSDILIRVTSFFRDPDVFAALQNEILPGSCATAATSRCASGCRVRDRRRGLLAGHRVSRGAGGDWSSNVRVQIFGTDISDASIDRARIGIYPETSPPTSRRSGCGASSRKSTAATASAKSMRDCCIFARQNLTKDPPFSTLDLISCRNVLIYLGAALQRRVMSIFHYALQPEGYLLLGNSETIGNYGELFTIVDRTQQDLSEERRDEPPADRSDQRLLPLAAHQSRTPARRDEEGACRPESVPRSRPRVCCRASRRAGVVIDENMEILQFRGRTSLFLESNT